MWVEETHMSIDQFIVGIPLIGYAFVLWLAPRGEPRRHGRDRQRRSIWKPTWRSE